MRVTRDVATAPSDRARGIAASSPRPHRPGCRSPAPRRRPVSTSSRPDALPPGPGQDAAVEEHGDAVGARHAHHADRSAVEDGQQGGGRRVPDHLGQRGGRAPRTRRPWTAAQSRTSQAVTDPAQLRARGRARAPGPWPAGPATRRVLADSTTKPRRSSWARRTSPPRWSQTLQRPRRGRWSTSRPGRCRARARCRVHGSAGRRSAAHRWTRGGWSRSWPTGPGRCGGRRRRGGGGADATGPWSAPHRVGGSVPSRRGVSERRHGRQATDGVRGRDPLKRPNIARCGTRARN